MEDFKYNLSHSSKLAVWQKSMKRVLKSHYTHSLGETKNKKLEILKWAHSHSNGKGSVLFLTNLRIMEGMIVGLACTGTNLKAKIHQTECWTVMSVYMQSILFVCFILTGTTSVSSVLYLHIPGLVSHPGCIPCLTPITRRVNSRSTVIMSRIKCLWNTNKLSCAPCCTSSVLHLLYTIFIMSFFLLYFY